MPKHRWGLRSGLGNYDGSEFSPNSEIYGKGDVRNSNILDYARVISSNIIKSEVSGEAIVANSRIAYSKVQHNAVVEGARLWKATVRDNARITGNALVKHTVVMDYAQVSGTAVVVSPYDNADLVLGGYDFFDRGLWTRRPVTYVSTHGFVVTENVGKLVTVQCTTNTFDKWYKAGRRYGEVLGIPRDEMDEIETYVREMEKMKMSSDYDRKYEL